jgi:RES domain-containing protein
VITASRIVKAKHAAMAFDGEGARLAGGRWNSPGAAMVYTAGSAALATLEMLVHLGKGTVLHAYVLSACSFDESIVLRLDRTRLPSNWRAYPAPSQLQMIGDAWVKSEVSAVLEVPSAVIETESNYLLNPRHRDFASITISATRSFTFDTRLLDR